MLTPRLDLAADLPARSIEAAVTFKRLAFEREAGLARQFASLNAARLPGCTILGEPAILMAMDLLVPDPPLFPNGNGGMPMALSKWRDHMAAAAADEQLANLGLVGRQIADGRPFLQGESPGLADIMAYGWIASLPEDRWQSLSTKHLADWWQRLSARLARLSEHARPLLALDALVIDTQAMPHPGWGRPARLVTAERRCPAVPITLPYRGMVGDLIALGGGAGDDLILVSPLSHSVGLAEPHANPHRRP